jgi:hypothetical protein
MRTSFSQSDALISPSLERSRSVEDLRENELWSANCRLMRHVKGIGIFVETSSQKIDAEMFISGATRRELSRGCSASRSLRRRRQLDHEGVAPSDEMLTSDCGKIREGPNKRRYCHCWNDRVQSRLAVTCQFPVRFTFLV